LHFRATDVFDYYKPSRCARRVALKAAGVEPQETDTPFLELLRKLGARHESGHLQTLSGVQDLSGLDQRERERLTLEAIRDGAPAIYQPRFRLEFPLDGESCELVGEPDFLIRDAARGGHLIRDSKLARNVLSDRHAGIPLQLQI
jgi:predicted RecB family nuclease